MATKHDHQKLIGTCSAGYTLNPKIELLANGTITNPETGS